MIILQEHSRNTWVISKKYEAKIKNEKGLYLGFSKPLREFLFVDDLSDCINL